MDATEKLLTPIEAAEVLALSSRQVVKFAKQGRLPVVRLPDDEIRFSPSDLRAFIDRNRHSEALSLSQHGTAVEGAAQ